MAVCVLGITTTGQMLQLTGSQPIVNHQLCQKNTQDFYNTFLCSECMRWFKTTCIFHV